MNTIIKLALQTKIWKDNQGQDLIEYALLAGFVALAAGATFPSIAANISTIFSRVNSVLSVAANS